ncbi:hypothetical protein LMG28138_05668 [Pararobbsia alpina]|uniref:Uncharacterized protein n=1 Tax=Pararobbsia alpina TaxID=621374 RepID=A0A6S7DGJ0_9BURK|nr:hypothetical protein [Pararobbsia alpina]CAB3805450.1 hypothetical protein LMG28138_05668 [Pararobbsia alpina]
MVASRIDVPAIIISGTPAEADRFLVAALWTGEEPVPTISAVTEWTNILHMRGDDFASHASACLYWLFEQKATQAGRLLRARIPRRSAVKAKTQAINQLRALLVSAP